MENQEEYSTIFPRCYQDDPCLFKIPRQEFASGQLIRYSACTLSTNCFHRLKNVNRLSEEGILEKNVK